ncbi:hypothetical protein D3C72_1662310 [compost metagenome]
MGQIHQAQQVGHSAARASQRSGRLLMRKTEVGDQAVNALRFFQGIEVFALDVLDQRHGRGGQVVHIAHQHRHFRQAGQLRSAETAFAGDDFIFDKSAQGVLSDRAHQDRLHQPLRLDRGGQLIQGPLVHARARLVFARLHLRHGQVRRLIRVRTGEVATTAAQQGVESATQSF